MNKDLRVRNAILPLLKQGEFLNQYTWGVQRPGCLVFIVVILMAAIVSWFFFVAGSSRLLSYLFFLALIGIAEYYFVRGHILVLTDHRLLIVKLMPQLMPQYFTLNPRISGWQREYILDSPPKVTLTRLGRRRTLVLFTTDLKLKLDIGNWPENIKAAEAIAEQIQKKI